MNIINVLTYSAYSDFAVVNPVCLKTILANEAVTCRRSASVCGSDNAAAPRAIFAVGERDF
jgi:hypothetical protein